jgi:hypothetical protein
VLQGACSALAHGGTDVAASVAVIVYGLTTVLALLLCAAPVWAQGELVAALVPTELSLGVGGAIDRDPARSTTAVGFGLARPPSLGLEARRDQWVEPAFEAGLGGISTAAPCLGEGPIARPETCQDVYAVIGPRLRPLRASDRLWRPFVHVLIGAYWEGTGLKEPATSPSDFAIQSGGGVDLRRPTSIHGLRLSGDYRHVFADERSRHQVQVLVSYFVGWRGRPRN